MAKYGYTSHYLTKNDRPWFPVMGEMHYSRYPKEYWKESLYKMKAGGVDIVSCYAIWIHHEEVEGQFDFTGNKNLRMFLQTAKECGMQVFLRIGPWIHGEVRNGGFPDWLLKKNIPLRCSDAEYLSYVGRYYEKLAEQAEGYLEKDGGPIIGIQIENEYVYSKGLSAEDREEHMRILRNMAIEAGLDAPYFTATGWGGASTGGMLPVMGGYCDAPWDARLTEIDPSGNYIFTPERNDQNIGSDHEIGFGLSFDPECFPFLTAELGGGLQATHHRRPVATGKDVGAMSLAKMGSGCTLLGYYMYHGGTNPDGKRTSLQESKSSGYPNDLPVKSYDFNAPIREFGQLSDNYREIRLLSLFVHDFGEELCRMKPYFPKENPSSPANQTDLRFMVRSNGKTGYLFVNNYQRHREMAGHTGVRIAVDPHSGEAFLDGNMPEKLKEELISFPAFDVENGDYFFFPFEMPLGDKATLQSALATLLCRLNGNVWVFYGNCDPQFKTKGDMDGITLLHISRKEALTASKITLDREYLVLSDSDVIPMEDGIHFQGTTTGLAFCTYPPLSHPPVGFCAAEENGFGVYSCDISSNLEKLDQETGAKPGQEAEAKPELLVKLEALAKSDDITEEITDSRTGGICPETIKLQKEAGIKDETAGIPEGYSKDGIVYRITMPELAAAAANLEDVFLAIDFAGDRLELYQDGALISDAFYMGQQVEIGLKRFGYPTELILKVFSYHDGDPVYLETIPQTEGGTACRVERIALRGQWDRIISVRNPLTPCDFAL